MSGRDGSSQWSSPPLSHNSDLLTYTSDDPSLPLAHHHHLMVPSQTNESGFCDTDSDVTASTRKQLHSPYSTGLGTLSSENSQYSHKGLEIPAVFQNARFPRSASIEDTQVLNEPAEVLAAVRPTRRRPKHVGKYPFSSLSQETYDYYRHQPYYSPSMSLSQSSHPPHFQHGSEPGMYYHKPGSPASSSDTSSLASYVAHRLGSQSASTISFLTNSSSASNPMRLPRPPSLSSSSGSHTSILPTKPMLSVPEYTSLTQQSDLPTLSQYSSHKGSQYDYEGDESMSTPVLPSMKQRTVDERGQLHPKHGHIDGARMPTEGQMRDRVVLRDREQRSKRPKRRPDQPRIPEEGNPRDSFHMKLDMVLSVLSLVSGSKDQSDNDAATILLALSESSQTCSVLRQSACMNMLVQIMHNIASKGEKSHRDARIKAARAMRNIIESSADTRQGKYEMNVLGVLEKLRNHSDMIFAFIHSHPANRRIDSVEAEALRSTCEAFMSTVRKLYKFSNEKEHYRPAILNLGGLQATAEILIVNYKLMASQKSSRSSMDKVISHSAKTITVVISILINLTYGDVSNKSLLCHFPEFLKALMYHLRQQNEIVIGSGAQVLRNLSWRASVDVKESLLECDAAVTLVATLDYIRDETTTQHVTSALWNLSAHSVDNRHKICSTHAGIQQLVELLSFNSPSGTTAVVENVGGILKNLSVVIMQDASYRRKFREVGGLAKLVQHLKSKNKTVLANATGILWNLSARNHEDQKLLWDLGCIPLLDVLQTSRHKSIAECSRGALRNLLAFGQTNGWTSKSDVTAYNIKTQRGLSKSLSYAANYAFSHGASQSGNSKQSNESLPSRRTNPHPKSKTSSLSLSEARGSSRRLDTGYDYKDGHSSGEDEEDFQASQKSKSKLKFSRVSSAPQPPMKRDEEEEELELEWSSYVPNPSYVKQNSSSSLQQAKAYPDEPRRKKAPKPPRRGQTMPMTFSQAEPYHLSSNSELHSVGGTSYGFSPRLTDDPVEVASLSALGTDLDEKLENFDPTGGAAARPHEEYADLDFEAEEDEGDDIDLHPPLEGDYSLADNFARVQNTMRRGYEYEMEARGGHLGRLSPSKGGTSNLALDGTRESAEISEGRGEAEELRRSRSQGSKKVITEV